MFNSLFFSLYFVVFSMHTEISINIHNCICVAFKAYIFHCSNYAMWSHKTSCSVHVCIVCTSHFPSIRDLEIERETSTDAFFVGFLPLFQHFFVKPKAQKEHSESIHANVYIQLKHRTLHAIYN